MIRQGSIDDINSHQFLKISNYEDTVRQLDIYYAIGMLLEPPDFIITLVHKHIPFLV